MDNKEQDFDFYGKQSEENFKQQNKNNIKSESFLNIGKNTLLSIGLVTLIGGGGYLGYNAYQNNIDEKIKNAETLVASTNKDAVFNLLSKEKEAAQKTFTNSQLLIGNFARYKELMDVINYGNKLAVFNTNNAKLYKQTNESLDKDRAVIEKVYNAMSGTRDQKISTLLNSEDISKFNQWSSNVKNQQFMYVGGLIALNKDLVGQYNFLDKTQQEIVKEVQQRIKNKDFNLELAQAKFQNQVQTEISTDVQDIKQARLELKDTEDALKEEGEDASGIAKILTDKDVENTTVALSAVEKEALGIISEDKNKVESLIAKASANNGVLPGTTTENTSTQQANASGGSNFLNYYLMYAWMSSMSNNNAYANGFAAGNNNNAVSKSIGANSASLYSVKNDNSHLNKSLTQKSGGVGGASYANAFGNTANAAKPNINTLRSQINNTRARATQVKSTRAAELSRMGYANSYEAGKKGSISRGVKSSVSKSSSSISRNSIGSRSGGFGG